MDVKMVSTAWAGVQDYTMAIVVDFPTVSAGRTA